MMVMDDDSDGVPNLRLIDNAFSGLEIASLFHIKKNNYVPLLLTIFGLKLE